MKSTSLILLAGLVFLCGCASMQATRKAQYLSDQYEEQVKKDIFVISLIDARPNKAKDLKDLLSNKVIWSECVLNPLKRKGYAPRFIDADTSQCVSLDKINNINEMVCFDGKIFESGDLFLLTSIDQYSPPTTGMSINGKTKVTGVLYSRSKASFIWKDSVEGTYDSISPAMYGLGGYAAKLMLKSMTPDLTFRSNAFGSIKELLNSLPPFPNKRE